MTDRGVHAAALASLPRAGARRLYRLLAGRDPAQVWDAVGRGLIPAQCGDEDLRASWRRHAAAFDLDELASALDRLDAWVTTPLDAAHPARLTDDIDPAPVIFRRGSLPVPAGPTAAIVGTRRCSPTGRSFSAELGAGLAAAGVSVVSGLALGVDGAAHRGALSAAGAPPVGVVGSGLDVVYPRGNADLWEAVAAAGGLITEAPLGAEPEAWRFPARNRLLAALADVVVVVESKEAGGSMHTVEQAIRRGVTVMAVPGSVRNPAAAGANRLISEGCPPACSVDDVLVALGFAAEARPADPSVPPADPDLPASAGPAPLGMGVAPASSGGASASAGPALAPSALSELQRRVLDAVDDEPVTLDRLVVRVGAAPPEVLVAADVLVTRGLLDRDGGKLVRAGP